MVWAGEGFVARRSKALYCVVERGSAVTRERVVRVADVWKPADDNTDEEDEEDNMRGCVGGDLWVIEENLGTTYGTAADVGAKERKKKEG